MKILIYNGLSLEYPSIIMWLYGIFKRFEREGFDRDRLKESLLQNAPSDYRELCMCTYENLSNQLGCDAVTIIGDKNPYYSLYIARILKVFDGIKFIFIVRDYRGNVVSYKNASFDMNNIYSLAL